jgi:hypothetical protein
VAEPATPHATHDQALVAAYAADDLAGTAHGAAEQLLARCPACARLADDLRAIALATRALPAPVRPRSFTIAPEQAERLRPTGWRRLVGSGRRPELGLLRPLAATLTTLGVAGLLLTALPAGPAALLGVAGRTDGRAGAPAVTEFGAPAAPSAASSAASPAQTDQADPQGRNLTDPSPAASGDTVPGAAAASTDPQPPEASPLAGSGESQALSVEEGTIAPGPSPLLIASVISLVAGLAMLGLVVLAGRRAPDERGDGT